MALRFIVSALAFIVVAEQVNAGCLFPPVPCPIPGLTASSLSQAALNLPTSYPCQSGPTKIKQHADINIPLPLPSEIPIGNYCSCRKYGITPSLVACTKTAPAAPAAAPAPAPAAAPAPYIIVNAPAPAPVYAPAPAAAPAPAVAEVCATPALLQTVLGRLSAASAPAAVSAPAPAPAPAATTLVCSPAVAVSAPAPAPAAVSLTPALIQSALASLPASTNSCGCA